ncbi:helix-turn-helix domain-containing protein (plasmid) [Aliarcobacter lanthieri]|uniref:helix-turn-helix domain-containing protein n=1 Tax=Aliarcobacter lanthieri TaxID=1355374 RepID=UPI003AAFA5D8
MEENININLNKEYIIQKNKIYKKNIKELVKNKNMKLTDLSVLLGHSKTYISNSCNKNTTIISNNLLHRISIILECSVSELNKNI